MEIPRSRLFHDASPGPAHVTRAKNPRVRIFALTSVPTVDLKKALSLLHRGELVCPLTPLELTRNGLQNHLDAMLGHLRGLDTAGVRAVLTAVLAERISND